MSNEFGSSSFDAKGTLDTLERRPDASQDLGPERPLDLILVSGRIKWFDVAKGFGTTVSSMMRYPRSQTNSVRKALSRSVCPDQSACNILVKRPCDTVSSASARATQLLDVRSYRNAVR